MKTGAGGAAVPALRSAAETRGRGVELGRDDGRAATVGGLLGRNPFEAVVLGASSGSRAPAGGVQAQSPSHDGP
jgi:hypothetical protein